MVQASQRTDFTGPGLIRLLVRLSEINPRESGQTFADRLSQWLGWADAISLSSALDGSPAAAPAGVPTTTSIEEAQCARVRSALAAAIAEDMRSASAEMSTDFAPCRRRYIARQQAMHTSITALRGRLRETLAARSPAMARLASMDAVMEQVLGAHEHRLLATVPALLEKHFKRLPPDRQAPSDTFPDAFGRDMHSVLLAELDIRLQPVEGLLAALRSHPPTAHRP
ncbi:MAG: DUF3348 domain-containing protein [Comamonadaceae bacterium]|nr:MAG: DUF3348 domain-containing protein [Comamonadaceae bacterium]